MSDRSHPVCNECGGKGCSQCHNGWACIDDPNYPYKHLHDKDEKCNQCLMGWPLGKSVEEMQASIQAKRLNLKSDGHHVR